jgi:hypothetical protein
MVREKYGHRDFAARRLTPARSNTQKDAPLRARNLKPALFKNELLGSSDPLYTILFEGLWCMADREGRLQDRPVRIKAEIFPYRPEVDIEVLLGWLIDAKFIERYTTKFGSVISVIEFLRHQRPHKHEPQSELPAKNQRVKVRKNTYIRQPLAGQSTDNAGRRRSDSGSLIASSLIPDSGYRIPDSGSLTPGHAPAAPARNGQGGKSVLKNGSGERPMEAGPRSRDDARPANEIAMAALRSRGLT